MKNINLIEHPLLLHKLSILRDKKTSSRDFRENLQEISRLMAYEVFRNVKLTKIDISTPIAKTTGNKINQDINLFPILRAGQGFVSGFLSIFPNAKVGHIGLYRDKKTLQPVQYLFKYPKAKNYSDALNIILDPIIATGGTIIEALKILKKENITKNIKIVSIVSVNSSIQKILKEFPNVEIYLIAIDKKLDSNGYIVPGLGDAGDRIYGTK